MRLLASVVAFALLSAAFAAPDENLLPNGAFDTAEGWSPGVVAKGVQYDWSSDGGRGGSGALHVRAAPDVDDTCRIWWGRVEKPPTDSALKISGWIRGKGVEKLAAVCVQAWAGNDRNAGFATTASFKTLKGDFDWTYVQTVLPPVPNMDELAVLAFTAGPGEAFFDDLRVERTNEKPTGTTEPAPGLVLARGESELVAWKEGSTRLLLPVPLSYREQVPLTYELRTEPEGAVTATRLYEDKPGNFVVEATFGALKKNAKTRVFWRSLVLCGARAFDDVPQSAPLPEKWPMPIRPWLRSTYAARCDDLRFVSIAKELRAGTDDVVEVIRRVEQRAAETFRRQKGLGTDVTAVEALEKQGSCTSCANLVAAMLRACGVPARILAGYPLWSGPLQTHYIVEAYVPEYGWYPIESTMCRSPWQPYQQLEVSIVAPENEDLAKPRPGGGGGVPYLSLTETPDRGAWNIGGLPERKDCDHVAELVRALPTDVPWDAAYAAARTRWAAWLKSAKLDDKGRLATALQPDDVKATTAAELAKELAR